MKTLKELEFEYGESSYGNTLDHYVYEYMKSRVSELEDRLEEEKKSNHLLHQAMQTAESRGVEKGCAELERENERLSQKSRDYDDKRNECNRLLSKVSDLEHDKERLEKEVETLRRSNIESGILDKTGLLMIREGDVISWKRPYRTTQTHTGDNIPNGSYTEPMEPGIEIKEGVVVFKDGIFGVDVCDGEVLALHYINITYDLQTIQEFIGSPRGDLFDDPEEGDLQYLMYDVAKVENHLQLINYLSGIEIIQSSTPEQLDKNSSGE